MSATTTQLLSSGEFCKLRYDAIPVISASANVSFYTNNSKNAKFWVVTLLSQMSLMVLTLCSCVLYGSRSNLQVLPYTTSPDWFFYNRGGECLLCVTHWVFIYKTDYVSCL